jgi:hypothetical protein
MVNDLRYGLNVRWISPNSSRSNRYFSSPKHPDQPWGLTNLLFRKDLAFTPSKISQVMKLTTHPLVVPRLRMSGIKPPLPCVPSRRANGQLYLSFTFICLITIWFFSVDVKIHNLSRDRCIYSWWGILYQRMYGLILWGFGYSFISQHCIKFLSYIATKQKWYGECTGCHGEMLLKNMKCLSE